MLIKKIIGIIIFIFLCVIVANAQSQRPIPGTGILSGDKKPHTTDNKENTQDNQHGTDQSLLFIKIASSPNTQEEPSQSKKEKDERAAIERRSEVTTRIIASATIIQAIALILTIIVMVRTTKRQLRAYVFLDTIDIGNIIGSPPPPVDGQTAIPVGAWIFRPETGPMTAIIIKNSGKTPAYDVVHTGYIGIYEYPTPIFPAPPASPFKTVMAIPPDGRTSKVIAIEHPLTSEEIDNLIKGTHAIYVYGNITYKTFGKRRITNFRYMQNGLTAIIGHTTIMTGCEDGNDAN